MYLGEPHEHKDFPTTYNPLPYNGFVTIPKAVGQRRQFAEAVAEVAEQLRPNVVRIQHEFGDDWTGEPSVFFMVILSDAASRRDRLLTIANEVSTALVQQIAPLEEWGVLPYFSFRSQSEQAKLEPSVA